MRDGGKITQVKNLMFQHLRLPLLSFSFAAHIEIADEIAIVGEPCLGNPAYPGPLKKFQFSDDTVGKQRFNSLEL
jgi:hypothetical protein